jgi:hypothetical protein
MKLYKLNVQFGGNATKIQYENVLKFYINALMKQNLIKNKFPIPLDVHPNGIKAIEIIKKNPQWFPEIEILVDKYINKKCLYMDNLKDEIKHGLVKNTTEYYITEITKLYGELYKEIPDHVLQDFSPKSHVLSSSQPHVVSTRIYPPTPLVRDGVLFSTSHAIRPELSHTIRDFKKYGDF